MHPYGYCGIIYKTQDRDTTQVVRNSVPEPQSPGWWCPQPWVTL